MTRKQRIDPLDGWHHVMNRGVDRRRIFYDDIDRIEFGRCVAVACRRFGVEVHAYCLMDNHFHLLLRCPSGGLSDVMHLACGLYATFVNRRHGRVGHLFGDRFTSRLVTTPDYIVCAVRYIHRNALAIVGIERCKDHRWSSHQVYLGERTGADFIRTTPVLHWFADTRAFDRFVDGAADSRSSQMETSDAGAVDAVATLSAIDLVIAEQSSLSGRSTLAQRRATALKIAGPSNSSLRDAIMGELGISSPRALASAAFRARQHLADHPEGHTIIAAARTLIESGDRELPLAS